jgi:hypothetical protein
VALSPDVLFAWGDGGHMMVAWIASQKITNTTVLKEIDRLLKVPIKPVNVTAQSKDIVQASHWADDVRDLDGFAFSGDLHFIDMPFSPDHTPLPKNLPKPNNVVKALNTYAAILKDKKQTDAKRAEALRFIIHFVGDIHQPLHAVSRVTATNKNGDTGGNEFFLELHSSSGKTNTVKLHSYWDGGLGEFPKMGPNFAPPPVAQIPPAAKKVMTSFPDTDPNWKNGGPLGFQIWQQESTDLGKTEVYKTLVESGTPGSPYIKNGQRIAEKRVAWAGYRLAALLTELLR